MGGMGAEDLFSQLFGGGMFGGGRRPQSSGPRRGKDIMHPIKVTLEDLYLGKTTKLRMRKKAICNVCEGRGGKEGAVKTCSTCRGSGVEMIMRQLGPMIQQIQQPCRGCDGQGEICNPKDRCKKCNGKKTVEESNILEVNIDKGMKDGQKIVFTGESDQAPGVVPGDVVVVVQEEKHPHFERKGDDLYYKAKIDLLTALAGGQFVVEQLDKRLLAVNVLPCETIRPGELKMIHNEGMPQFRLHHPGDLYIQFEVEFPKPYWTDNDTAAKLEAILPPRNPINLPPGAHAEDVVLSSVDEARQARNNAMEEDDEDGHNHGPGVACAQQ